jgi:hypothetical protein
MRLFVFILVAYPFLALANDIEIISLKGEVFKIDSNNERLSLVKGMRLQENEVLVTGQSSSVLLQISGHSFFKVESSSRLKVEKLPYFFEDSKLLEQGASLKLEKGTLFCRLLEQSDIVSMRVTTKNSIISSRGASFVVDLDSVTNDVWVVSRGKEVEVQNDKSTHHDVLSSEQALMIENDRGFTQIRQYQWTKKIHWYFKSFSSNNLSFQQLRESANKEFHQSRQKWVRNEVLWDKKSEKWKNERLRWKHKTAELKPNKLRLERKDLIRRKSNKFRNKSFKRNLFKQNSSHKPNEFMNR